MVRLYQEGLGVKRIARSLHINRPAVRAFIEEDALTRHAGPWNKGKRSWNVGKLQHQAFLKEQAEFRRGDEQRHWGNHPVRIRFLWAKGAIRRDRQRGDWFFKNRLANRIRHALKHQHQRKNNRTIDLVGCSIPELRAHLEAQFTAQMSWANYGKVWHIDHIIACAGYDLSDPAQQRQCFHYTNLQPLEASLNIRKGNEF